jgi:hypothetical protein
MAKRDPSEGQHRLASGLRFDEEERRQLRADAKTDPSTLFQRGVALNRAARLFHEAGQKARHR